MRAVTDAIGVAPSRRLREKAGKRAGSAGAGEARECVSGCSELKEERYLNGMPLTEGYFGGRTSAMREGEPLWSLGFGDG